MTAQDGTNLKPSHKTGTTCAEACPEMLRVNEVLSRVGDRWSLLIVMSLARYEVLRFNELKRHLGISQRMLSLKLNELERDGLVHRKAYPTIPPKVEYRLSKIGENFFKAAHPLGLWAYDNLDAIDEARNAHDKSCAR